MATLTNPKGYEDNDGNTIVCHDHLGPNVVVIFRGKNNTLIIDQGAILQKSKIMFDCDNGVCIIKKNRFIGDIRIGQDCKVEIGKDVTCTLGCYISTAEHACVTIGDDCMFAAGNEIRADDGHPIFDVKTGNRVNNSRSIVIGEHVWIGTRSIILGGANIGEGSVIGTGSVVKGNIPNNCVAAGSPARVVRRDCAWERPHLTLSKPFYKPHSSTINKTSYWNLTNE